MYNKTKDIEYINSLAEYYPKTEDELKLVVLKLLSLPCSKSLGRSQFITLCQVNESKFNQKQALRSVEKQIQKLEEQLSRTPHSLLKHQCENLHTVHNALETCIINYQQKQLKRKHTHDH
jgi:hypothetical protein